MNVKQKAIHSIIEEVNYKESMASKDFRFNMGKLKRVKVFWISRLMLMMRNLLMMHKNNVPFLHIYT
jgi:hypothetical protein